MHSSAKLGRIAAACVVIVVPCRIAAPQDNPVQRVANIVSVAVEEYGKGIDARGRLLSADEYQEAVGFLNDARAAANRLPGNRTASRALLDTIITEVAAKHPPAVLAQLEKRFAASLGSQAAL